MKYFTLHIRLTKSCNADCSYCSSRDSGAIRFMAEDDYKNSIIFLRNLIAKLHGNLDYLAVEYIGGEILLLPPEVLRNYVLFTRREMSKISAHVKDGTQSNFLSSNSRIDHLIDLFSDNVSTSVDHFTKQRTIGGSFDRYQKMFLSNTARVAEKHRVAVPAVFVVDRKGLLHIHDEVDMAEQGGYSLSLRPVFDGSSLVEHAKDDEVIAGFMAVLDKWFMRSERIIDPFHYLLGRRLYQHGILDSSDYDIGCPFQVNCAEVSLNLEPNGDLYVCQDMADSRQFKLGNSLDAEFDETLHKKIRGRSVGLDRDCFSCDYYRACQGGCMSESISHGNGMYGKTRYCRLWKTLFRRMDELIQLYDVKAIRNWYVGLSNEAH